MVVRPTMFYGTEYWPLKEKHNIELSVVGMSKIRWMCGFTLRNKIRNEHILERLK